MKTMKLLLLSLVLMLCLTAFAAAADVPRLDDSADLLTDSEETELLAVLDEISERQQFDVVVVTTNTLNGKTVAGYADDYFDDNGFGFGADRDGILLLLNMAERDWWISTSGYGLTAFTDHGLDDMADVFLPYLSGGYYAEGFSVFAGLCDDYVTQAKQGMPYGYNDYGDFDNSYGYDDYYGDANYGEQSSGGASLMAALVIGLIGAFIVTSSMKAQLKSVRQQNAGAYVKEGSLKLTDSREMFLYRNVTKTVRQDNNSHSGGGSHSHRSSSGRSHGGRGGRF